MADRKSPDDQPQPDGTEMGWRALGYLLSGIIFWGGAGYLVDLWLGLPKVGLMVGMLVGAAAGMYLLIKQMSKLLTDID
ncbi:AtpZ/AtpI family protein [Glycomyces xiaoerkulensis]|uniref:AtpZ/AtpI family protein n=1 Tax=Glycomyces xiaoerkulensis TaxID=2038139 RepID=UPI000C264D3A|nr:AtpZ/AtpI family protein [Glycomyces xiaoerkulensis]